MDFHTEIRSVRSTLAEVRGSGRKIGVVPTMGALHQGHLHLARTLKPKCDFLVMWVFVNPTQFDRQSDFDNYPREIEKDRELAASVGVDLLFAPSQEEIYSRGLEAYQRNKSCRVFAGDRSHGLEGEFRNGHFDGVVHVVTLFFNIIRPDVAVFGEKDFQQVQVIRQLVEDLHLGVEIETAPILRNEDGLALSSRNQLLSPGNASIEIWNSLKFAQEKVKQGHRSAEELCAIVSEIIAQAGLEVEYVKIVDANTLQAMVELRAPAQILVAAYAGDVRLIDTMNLFV